VSGSEIEQLHATHGRRLFGLAWQLTLNAADAEDAVQETFLRALAAWSSYEEREHAGAWLTRILVNVVRDAGRRRSYYQRHVEPNVPPTTGTGIDPTPDPERSASLGESLEAIRDALSALPPSFREVLVLRHFEERSTRQVAEVLALPEATVRTRLKRARAMIVARLESGNVVWRKSP
jgi:RNA polymerase sigma-70 factor (ECF subfamily)